MTVNMYITHITDTVSDFRAHTTGETLLNKLFPQYSINKDLCNSYLHNTVLHGVSSIVQRFDSPKVSCIG